MFNKHLVCAIFILFILLSYSKEIQPVHPKGNQFWIFIGRTDAEAEALILWPPDAKNWFTGKDPHAGKDWRQEEKGTTDDEMVGCHQWPNGHEFEQAPGVGDGQGGLACCSPWGREESDTTEWLNWLVCARHCAKHCTLLSYLTLTKNLQASLVAQTVKNLPNAGVLGSIPGPRRSTGEGDRNPL